MMDIEEQLKELLKKTIAKINEYGSRILQEPVYEEGEKGENWDLHTENQELRSLCDEVSARLKDHFENEEKNIFLSSDENCSESCSSEATA